ncbi:hypothetical protein NDU88_002453 [Pleurodeles waltl]|uniref:Uncharacterized protein n=1 Tax=Pleurodeles waltl TaxID=8319 RepID=A0AAV7WPL2_PLEWA|nr:hypothetical protein NDU88_002453 [Pleurodeles waltl]
MAEGPVYGAIDKVVFVCLAAPCAMNKDSVGTNVSIDDLAGDGFVDEDVMVIVFDEVETVIIPVIAGLEAMVIAEPINCFADNFFFEVSVINRLPFENRTVIDRVLSEEKSLKGVGDFFQEGGASESPFPTDLIASAFFDNSSYEVDS